MPPRIDLPREVMEQARQQPWQEAALARQAVYGAEAAYRLYGELLPVAADRILEAGDGFSFLAGLWALMEAEAVRQGWTLAADQWRAVLEMDIELNAQGLDYWLEQTSR